MTSNPSSQWASRRSRTALPLDTLVVHYAEIGTKGKNRGFFEHVLLRNLEKAIAATGYERTRLAFGRVTVSFEPGTPVLEAARRAAKVLGVAYVGAGATVGKDLEQIKDVSLELLSGAPEGSFRVTARRAMSEFSHSSQEINQEVGAHLAVATARPVSLKDPQVSIYVEMFGSGGVVYADRFEGPAGLPSGTGGKVLALLSGGIDSPVAAWRMARRGAEVELLHFHGQPFTDPSSARQAEDLAAALAAFPPGLNLHLVPLGDAQQEIAVACAPELRMVLYRRMMMRIAEELGRELDTEAIVSGDSLGQVASQTLTNMAVVDDATSVPVLRPLVGMTKDEIIATAQAIGTFDISTRKHQDCCVLFEPRSPATKASLEHIRRAEGSLDLEALVAKALAGRETRTF